MYIYIDILADIPSVYIYIDILVDIPSVYLHGSQINSEKYPPLIPLKYLQGDGGGDSIFIRQKKQTLSCTHPATPEVWV